MRRFFDYDFYRLSLDETVLEGDLYDFLGGPVDPVFASLPGSQPLYMDDYPSDTSTMGTITLGNFVSGVFEDTGGVEIQTGLKLT